MKKNLVKNPETEKNFSFNRSSIKFDRSKIWKNQFFEKTEHFNVETPQNIVYYEQNA